MFFDRAIFHLENKDYTKALNDLSIALMLNYPDRELIHYNMGVAEINLGNTGAACKEFKQSGEMAKEFLDKYCK